MSYADLSNRGTANCGLVFFFFLYTVSIQKTRLYHAHSTDFKIHLRELERKISVLVDIVLTANVI